MLTFPSHMYVDDTPDTVDTHAASRWLTSSVLSFLAVSASGTVLYATTYSAVLSSLASPATVAVRFLSLVRPHAQRTRQRTCVSTQKAITNSHAGAQYEVSMVPALQQFSPHLRPTPRARTRTHTHKHTLTRAALSEPRPHTQQRPALSLGAVAAPWRTHNLPRVRRRRCAHFSAKCYAGRYGCRALAYRGHGYKPSCAQQRVLGYVSPCFRERVCVLRRMTRADSFESVLSRQARPGHGARLGLVDRNFVPALASRDRWNARETERGRERELEDGDCVHTDMSEREDVDTGAGASADVASAADLYGDLRDAGDTAARAHADVEKELGKARTPTNMARTPTNMARTLREGSALCLEVSSVGVLTTRNILGCHQRAARRVCDRRAARPQRCARCARRRARGGRARVGQAARGPRRQHGRAAQDCARGARTQGSRHRAPAWLYLGPRASSRPCSRLRPRR